MKITVIGSGYVGLVTAVCLAEMGNNVFSLDLDQAKIAMLKKGQSPIYEPGLDEMIIRNCQLQRLHFSTDVEASIAHGDIQFIAVGTPSDEDGSADLKYVIAAAHNIARYMTGSKIIVNKSTVPVGTADKVKGVICKELEVRNKSELHFSVVSNPEFLKEGAAIDDFMRPDRIVIGHEADASGMEAKITMEKLYAPFSRNHNRILCMDVRSAELTKYAANAMLATRISFMNELANLADAVHADIEMVRHGIGSDSRIGYDFLYAGTGYGGSCFPKDVRALTQTAKEYGKEMRILHAVEKVNDDQKKILVEKIIQRLSSNLSGKKIAIWGLAFKPNTDDMRDAPSRIVIHKLLTMGATVVAHDPVAQHEAERVLAQDLAHQPELLKNLLFVDSPMDAVNGADALVIVTEWKTFRSPDFADLITRLAMPIIFDGRNLYDPSAMHELGFEYFAIGRAVAV